mmetsp:Transcript_2164/g.2907  ORF Transcript_2164/g.2907 Transcript_2164/m.2907 type:complete len:287 (-) Transcript_2164:440-1300(-)
MLKIIFDANKKKCQLFQIAIVLFLYSKYFSHGFVHLSKPILIRWHWDNNNGVRYASPSERESQSQPEIESSMPERSRPRRRRTLPMPTAPPTTAPLKPVIEVQRKEIPQEVPIVGNPQQKPEEKEYSIDTVLKELAEIQNEGPKRYCILGTRHCSFGHQQIIELLAYALVLSGNHVYTSGAGGTNAAVIRGALRADNPDLLTVILPQSLEKQPEESQELLRKVENLITSPQNDNFEMELAAKLCNSNLLSRAQQLIAFAYHDSDTVINAAKEAMELDILVTICYLD